MHVQVCAFGACWKQVSTPGPCAKGHKDKHVALCPLVSFTHWFWWQRMTKDEFRLIRALPLTSPARTLLSPTAYPGATICLFTEHLTSPVDIYMHMPKLKESLKNEGWEDLGCSQATPCFLHQASWNMVDMQEVKGMLSKIPSDTFTVSATPWQAKTIALV